EIPEPVREIYKLWRPTPMMRARRLELALDTPAHIYYKYEGVSPVGSHKPNTAVAQAFYNKEAGTKALTTETGAGQWGAALAMACNFFDLDLEVYMVKVSYDLKPYRRHVMQTYGAQVFASPTDRTHYGRSVLAQDPENPGSLGMAISEAVEVAATSGGTKKYSLGSVLNHVLMHQTVIGQKRWNRWKWRVNILMWSSAVPVAALTSPVLPFPSCIRISPMARRPKLLRWNPVPARL
ncbi:MAG: pyridoxal-phosphate dependent enzyme, partial [Chloroflexi bacterium]|nr:pyridoxal-phosphate dependent enzyme [Chloroflexota bacterium]